MCLIEYDEEFSLEKQQFMNIALEELLRRTINQGLDSTDIAQSLYPEHEKFINGLIERKR